MNNMNTAKPRNIEMSLIHPFCLDIVNSENNIIIKIHFETVSFMFNESGKKITVM